MAAEANSISLNSPMSGTHFATAWNSLIDDLETVKYGKIRNFQGAISEDASETSSEASGHSNTSRYRLTKIERQAVHSQDHERCFVTKMQDPTYQVAHILDNSNSGNRKLVDALRGLGIVHREFNLADMSNLLLMEPGLHYKWDKFATFIIVPSQETRSQMIQIVSKDRNRIALGVGNNEAVEPGQLAYPEAVTYDIILVEPSRLGPPGAYFQRADERGSRFMHYEIPSPLVNPGGRRGYLTKIDDGAHVSEFLDEPHLTSRLRHQALNPYLIVMNALQKFESWSQRGFGRPGADPDLVFITAYKSCQQIMSLISSKEIRVDIMSRVHPDGQPKGSEQDDMPDDKDLDKTPPSNSSKDLTEELQSPMGSAHPQHDPSTQSGMQSWLSRGLDKTLSLETWRQEVSEFSDAV